MSVVYTNALEDKNLDEAKKNHEQLHLSHEKEDPSNLTINCHPSEIDKNKLRILREQIQHSVTTLNLFSKDWKDNQNHGLMTAIFDAIQKSKTLKNLNTNLFFPYFLESDFWANYAFREIFAKFENIESFETELSLIRYENDDFHAVRHCSYGRLWPSEYPQKCLYYQLQAIAALPNLRVLKLKGLSIPLMDDACFDLLIDMIQSHKLTELHLSGAIFRLKNVNKSHTAVSMKQLNKCIALRHAIHQCSSLKTFCITEQALFSCSNSLDLKPCTPFSFLDKTLLATPKMSALTLDGNSNMLLYEHRGPIENNGNDETSFLFDFINHNIDNLSLSELKLRNLTLKWDRLNVIQKGTFSEALARKKTLTKIALNNLNFNEFPYLISILTRSESLATLDLSSNPFFEDHMVMSSLFSNNAGAATLRKFSKKECQEILQAFHHGKVKHLILRDCKLDKSSEKFETFCTFVEKNNNLKTLDLRENAIENWSETKFNHFMNALEKNHTLTTLIIEAEVPFSDDPKKMVMAIKTLAERKEKINKIMERNKQLETLQSKKTSLSSNFSVHSEGPLDIGDVKLHSEKEGIVSVYPSLAKNNAEDFEPGSEEHNALLPPLTASSKTSSCLSYGTLVEMPEIVQNLNDSRVKRSEGQPQQQPISSPSAPSFADLLQNKNELMSDSLLPELDNPLLAANNAPSHQAAQKNEKPTETPKEENPSFAPSAANAAFTPLLSSSADSKRTSVDKNNSNSKASGKEKRILFA